MSKFKIMSQVLTVTALLGTMGLATAAPALASEPVVEPTSRIRMAHMTVSLPAGGSEKAGLGCPEGTTTALRAFAVVGGKGTVDKELTENGVVLRFTGDPDRPVKGGAVLFCR